MRLDERRAERAASPSSPCSDSASSSRFASTLVSGVRSSCDASATKRRWRASIASVSPRAASSSRSIPSSVRASSPTSSSACGWGTLREGSRVRAICSAVAVSSAIGAIARRAIATPASSAKAAPANTPSSRNSSTRAIVAFVSATERPYWITTRPIGSPLPAIPIVAGRLITRYPAIVLRIVRRRSEIRGVRRRLFDRGAAERQTLGSRRCGEESRDPEAAARSIRSCTCSD